MLITIQGLDIRKIGVVGILASITAFNKSRKTLMIQLTNNSQYSIENKMIGKIMDSRSINGRNFTSKFEKGIDALIRESTTGVCDDEVFTDCCESLIISKNNMLDIACISQKSTFENEIVENFEQIKGLLNSAQKVYEYVYVLLPNNDEIVEKMTELSNFNIYCVPQSQEKSKALYTIGKKDFLVVTDFEAGSMFNQSYIKKMYNIFTIYTLPHDIRYKDAFMTNNAFEFIKKNVGNTKMDDNYSFSSSLNALVAKLTYSEQKEEKAETQEILENLPEEEISEYDMDGVEEDELPDVIIKKTFFGKKKVAVSQKNNVPVEKHKKQTVSQPIETAAPVQNSMPLMDTSNELERMLAPAFDRNNINHESITEMRNKILTSLYGTDANKTVMAIRESLMSTVIYALSIESKTMPEDLTIDEFSKFVKKLNVKALQKKFKKAPEAEMEAMAFLMAAPNAQVLLMKELPQIATRLYATGKQLLSEI